MGRVHHLVLPSSDEQRRAPDLLCSQDRGHSPQVTPCPLPHAPAKHHQSTIYQKSWQSYLLGTRRASTGRKVLWNLTRPSDEARVDTEFAPWLIQMIALGATTISLRTGLARDNG